LGEAVSQVHSFPIRHVHAQFEINRGGKNLTRERLHVLQQQAKQQLRRLFGRPLN
jgi:hypothetical protein